MMRLLCLLGIHKRSRSRVHEEEGKWVSRCRRCAQPMERLADGKWIIRDE